MPLEFVVLGSAQDGGVPQLGSSHPVSAAGGLVPTRTASSLAVLTEAGAVLLDVSPDIRHQLALLGESALAGLAITHGHMGHYAGLLQFGKEAANAQELPLIVTPSMLSFLEANQPWRDIVTSRLATMATASRVSLAGVQFELIPVPHRADYTDTVAISVEGSVLYLPDIDRWDAWPEAEAVIAAHGLAFLDATFWSPDEVLGNRSVAEVPHPPVIDTLQRFSHLADRIVLTHLNHTNPVADPASPEAAEVVAAGFRIAADGMRFVV